ncbi:MAG: DUF4430 domain-containing protein [Clostridiaceae bacterium]|nr:DUF4430 domain-containing protein [Clostridiaceae bacterium]
MRLTTGRKSKFKVILALVLALSMSLLLLNACSSGGGNQASVTESQTSRVEASVEDSKTTQSEDVRTEPSTASNITDISEASSERTEVSAEQPTTEAVSQTSAATKVSTTTTEVAESNTSKASAPATQVSTTSGKMVVYLSVNCVNAVNANVNYASNYAPDGVMLAGKEITVDPGSSVFDVLKASGLTINASNSFLGAYVSSVQGISEGAAGAGKGGWIYSINGVFPNLSASNVTVKNGDIVFFHYTVTPGDVPGSSY